jgi:hypothetical protein
MMYHGGKDTAAGWPMAARMPADHIAEVVRVRLSPINPKSCDFGYTKIVELLPGS